MSLPENKKDLWAFLKERGFTPSKAYVSYTRDELKAAAEMAQQIDVPATVEAVETAVAVAETPGKGLANTPSTVSLADPLWVDEKGWAWYRKEIRKPAFAQGRAKVVRNYVSTGVKEVTHKAGEYTETYELAGDRKTIRQAEISLPAYQVGCYKDPQMPFRIHVYNNMRGFDYHEVVKYFGGINLVPRVAKATYVQNTLVWSIPSIIQAIEDEYNKLALRGQIQKESN